MPLPHSTTHQRLRKVGELSLPVICCSTQDCGPYAVPGQPSRAGPEEVGVGEPILRTRKQGNWLHPLSFLQRVNSPGQCWSVHPVGEDKGELVG